MKSFINDSILYIKDELGFKFINKRLYSLDHFTSLLLSMLVCRFEELLNSNMSLQIKFIGNLKDFQKFGLKYIINNKEPHKSYLIESVISFLNVLSVSSANEFKDCMSDIERERKFEKIDLFENGNNEITIIKEIFRSKLVIKSYKQIINVVLAKNYSNNDISIQIDNILDDDYVKYLYETSMKKGSGYSARNKFTFIDTEILNSYGALLVILLHEMTHKLIRNLDSSFQDFFNRSPIIKLKEININGDSGFAFEKYLFGDRVDKIGETDENFLLDVKNWKKKRKDFKKAFRSSITVRDANN